MIQAHSEIICWNDGGSEIVIEDTRMFAQQILPKYFRHNKLESFVRQVFGEGI